MIQVGERVQVYGRGGEIAYVGVVKAVHPGKELDIKEHRGQLHKGVKRGDGRGEWHPLG